MFGCVCFFASCRRVFPCTAVRQEAIAKALSQVAEVFWCVLEVGQSAVRGEAGDR